MRTTNYVLRYRSYQMNQLFISMLGFLHYFNDRIKNTSKDDIPTWLKQAKLELVNILSGQTILTIDLEQLYEEDYIPPEVNQLLNPSEL